MTAKNWTKSNLNKKLLPGFVSRLLATRTMINLRDQAMMMKKAVKLKSTLMTVLRSEERLKKLKKVSWG